MKVREKRGKQTLIKPIAPLKVLTIDDVRLAPSQCRSILVREEGTS